MKQFGCLKQVFWHADDLAYERTPAFRAVAMITQLSIDDGEPLFSVEYND